MKIRIGFVSNSSSSSFCAWGTDIEDISEDTYLKIYEYQKKNPYLQVEYDEDQTLYIGRPYSTLGDLETGQKFKKKAEEDIMEISKKYLKNKHLYFEHFEREICS